MLLDLRLEDLELRLRTRGLRLPRRIQRRLLRSLFGLLLLALVRADLLACLRDEPHLTQRAIFPRTRLRKNDHARAKGIAQRLDPAEDLDTVPRRERGELEPIQDHIAD